MQSLSIYIRTEYVILRVIQLLKIPV